jgi:hypothetical protein
VRKTRTDEVGAWICGGDALSCAIDDLADRAVATQSDRAWVRNGGDAIRSAVLYHAATETGRAGIIGARVGIDNLDALSSAADDTAYRARSTTDQRTRIDDHGSEAEGSAVKNHTALADTADIVGAWVGFDGDAVGSTVDHDTAVAHHAENIRAVEDGPRADGLAIYYHTAGAGGGTGCRSAEISRDGEASASQAVRVEGTVGTVVADGGQADVDLALGEFDRTGECLQGEEHRREQNGD